MAYKTTFMSHAHVDNAKCDPYEKALRKHGISIYYDRTNPQVGHDLSEALQREIQRAEALIVMVTPAALTSFWVREEISMFFALMAQDPSRLLIPVKIEPCHLPPRLAARWWIDATTQTLAQVVDQLVTTLKVDHAPVLSSTSKGSAQRSQDTDTAPQRAPQPQHTTPSQVQPTVSPPAPVISTSRSISRRTFIVTGVGGATVIAASIACWSGTRLLPNLLHGGTGANNYKALKIGTEFPVSGTDAAVGLPTQYGVDLAVQQNKNLGNGYTLDVVHKNDEGSIGADPSIGAANVQQLIDDSSVMAIVGPFNSGVAKQEIPIANQYGITLISPTNVNPGLTKQEYAETYGINFDLLHPAGKPNSYFRLPATDDVSGKVDADIALAAPVSATTVYVVDDDTAYGETLAVAFGREFTSTGGTVAGSASITPDQVSNLPQLAATIIGKNVDLVFYGGVTSGGGGALKKALVEQGGNMPLVGGDGIVDDPAWLTAAGAAAVNTYATVAAPDISGLTSTKAQDFISAYSQAFPGKDILPYSAMAYDAAMIEITAIKNLIKAGKDVTRAAVRDEVASITFDGVTGSISFDVNGDNAGQKVFSIYSVGADGKWSFDRLINT